MPTRSERLELVVRQLAARNWSQPTARTNDHDHVSGSPLAGLDVGARANTELSTLVAAPTLVTRLDPQDARTCLYVATGTRAHSH
jgi:hypothetical protein